MVDVSLNLFRSTVAVAPSPATSGVTLTLSAGDGAALATPTRLLLWPAGVSPTRANSEVVRVTSVSTDTVTVTRHAETWTGSAARSVAVGWQVAAVTTKGLLDQVTAALVPAGGASGAVLTKLSATDLDAGWVAPAGGAPSGSASGDLGGSYPGPTVTKLRGVVVPTAAPAANQVLRTVSTTDFAWCKPRDLDVSQAPYSVTLNDTVPPTGSENQVRLASAKTAALAAGVGLWLPAGTIQIGATVDFIADGLRVEGPGPSVCKLRLTGTNQPIIKLGGKAQRVNGISFEYAAQASAANTGSVAIELTNVFMGHYSDLRTYWANVALGIRQADTGGGQNTAFSFIIDGLEVNGWRTTALDLRSYVGNSTPAHLRNVYLHNNPVGSVEAATADAVIVQGFDSLRFDVLNVEWCTLSAGDVLQANGSGVSIGNLHVEGVVFATGGAVLDVYDKGTVTVDHLTIQNSTFQPGAGNSTSIVKSGGASGSFKPRTAIRALRWLGNNPAPNGNFYFHRSTDTTACRVLLDLNDGQAPFTALRNNGGASSFVVVDGVSGT